MKKVPHKSSQEYIESDGPEWKRANSEGRIRNSSRQKKKLLQVSQLLLGICKRVRKADLFKCVPLKCIFKETAQSVGNEEEKKATFPASLSVED